MTSGIVLLDKPAGLSSNHATRRLQRLFGAASAGHLGTLDPFATGLLPVMLGDATRLIRWLEGGDKVYRAEVCFGTTTDTLDREGAVLERRPVPADLDERLRAALPSFVGRLRQRVPEYSAAKVGGVRRCDLARAGRSVEPKYKDVEVRSLRRVEPARGEPASDAGGVSGTGGAGGSAESGRVALEVTCGGGTYVRQLVADLGQAVGCGAHTVGLRRTRVGTFGAELAVTFETIEPIILESRVSLFIDPRRHLPGPVWSAGEAEWGRLERGQ
ncbi:MAG: tRNA pseudouridine(55) synthase TruB, partial [Deltaproteobacteria bacterium]|nr:tRNA pseudouridine(55) synthase TruB [Deltaproteobacteria bacterium]